MHKKINNGFGGFVFDRLNEILMLMAIIITAYPLLYVLFASLSEGSELVKHSGILLWPRGDINFDAYKNVLMSKSVINGFFYSLFNITVGTAISMILTCMGGYVLSRKNAMLVPFIMMVVVLTMFFRGGLIPEFLTYKNLGFINSIWAPVIPFAINTFNLIILRTAFFAIPDSLEESARMDGANHFQILVSIMIPLIKPTLAVLTLYYAVEKWNAWFWPAVLLRDRSLYPLQLVLRDILILADETALGGAGGGGDEGQNIGATIKYATIIVATAPILIVYPYLQKYFVKGVMIGAVKG